MNHTVLITGGTRGLGRATAVALAERGVDVFFTYISSRDAAEALESELTTMGVTARGLHLDVSRTEAFPTFVAALRTALDETGKTHIDALVNNAGIGLYATVAATSEAVFDQLLAVHFKGPFFLTQALLPLLRDGGKILNISSGLTRFSYPGYAAYAAMKGALEVLTRYLAVELGPRRITVNTIAPGAVATDFGGGSVRDNADLNAGIAAQTALGRVATAEDIGPVVATMLSEGHGWVNGQRLEVSGGIFL